MTSVALIHKKYAFSNIILVLLRPTFELFCLKWKPKTGLISGRMSCLTCKWPLSVALCIGPFCVNNGWLWRLICIKIENKLWSPLHEIK